MQVREKKLTQLVCKDFPNFSGQGNENDVTTMFTLYSYANMPFGQSEHAYYLSCFIKLIIMGTYNSPFYSYTR